MLTGQNLIAGTWVATDETFENAPATGSPQRFSQGTPALVNQACEAAEAAFGPFSEASREDRAVLLETIAEEIDAIGDAITETAMAETALPEARLVGERGRTTGQLRLFAAHIRSDAFLDLRHDGALPDRQPLPRPDLRMMQHAIGPVAVFGASNFPLAFSVAGGDTASALAAGCPVVVKGHPAHPGTSELVAGAISKAVEKCRLPAGVFSLIQDGGIAVGQALVQHPLITAVGFTGSLRGGRALFDLCAARPDPIPFFGELGSINPMLVMPAALAARGEDIAKGWVGSLTMGVGQFCTNPGVALMIEGPDAEAFAAAAEAALSTAAAATMLTEGIAAAYRSGCSRLSDAADPLAEGGAAGDERSATPALFRVTGERWLADPELSHEVFGPVGVLVTVHDLAEMRAILSGLAGQLTATLHLDDGDHGAAAPLMPLLRRKAGRVLANGFPTGVEVADAMVHGGPYPASTNFGHTSVGTLAIRRWLRPVCYQNIPMALLPADLQQG